MRILLGVTGGIAAYKACEFVSLAGKAGHTVRVVMTASATRFVGPITFEALSGNPVLLDTFAGAPVGASVGPGGAGGATFGGEMAGQGADGPDRGPAGAGPSTRRDPIPRPRADEGAIDHIAWARWPDVVLVAPLSANTLGKLACGLADDALTTVLMAVAAGVPIVLAPAMNTEMWAHPVVRRNLRWLGDLGRYAVVDPVSKRLACGEVGPGALPDPTDLLAAVTAATRPPGAVADRER
jgi:phosphopantothenoylcysteine decarboxylase/phosphopantothenate--cysteine ligase